MTNKGDQFMQCAVSLGKSWVWLCINILFRLNIRLLGYGAGLRAGLKSGWLDQVGRFWH